MSNESVLSNFTLGKDDIISERLNAILHNFATNDKYVYGQFDKIPGVWKCLWYNDDRIRGHNKKDFFWLNTENRSNFFKNNAEEMRKMVDVNPAITNKLPPWKNNDEEVFNQYNNVLTGYFDSSKSMPYLPWAEIGTLSACTQLIVSQKDNNKDLISNKDAWKRFLVEEDDLDNIISKTQFAVDSAMEIHLSNYHFSEELKNRSPDEIIEILNDVKSEINSDYVNADFSNISASYPENYLTNDFYCTGFDTIDLFVKKPIPNRTLSGYVVEHQWFRQWQSGFLEHGGLLKVSECLNKDKTKIEINFDWELSSSYSKLYTVKYLGDTIDDIEKQLEVDESGEENADNLLSVLYELDQSYFNNVDKLHDSLRKTAPSFQSNDYSLNLTPVYPTTGFASLATAISYSGLGNNMLEKNVVASEIPLSCFYKNKVEIPYDSKTAPIFYSYYAAGFCLPRSKSN